MNMRVSTVLVLGVVSYLGPKLGDNDCKNKMKIPVISYAVTFGWFVPVTTIMADCLMYGPATRKAIDKFYSGQQSGGVCWTLPPC